MALGFDAGTYNLVVCKRDANKNFVTKREVNAFIELPLENRFVFNMMKTAGVPLIERPEANVAYALGEAAVNIAYTMGSVDLKRPMRQGCLNPKEKSAQQIMNIMVHSLLEELQEDGETLYYSVPANALNQETDADYHAKILEAIFKAFKDKNGRKVTPYRINEALALIYAELAPKAYTGIGISFGAGMVNLAFAMYGNPIFQFSIVNSGDWIDKMAAKATGETEAFINKEKTKIDLTVEPDTLVLRAVKAQYEIMVQKTVSEIKKGLETTENKARADAAIDIVVSGGTASPKGFETLFESIIKKSNMPIQIGNVIKPKDTLYSVARGALLAAEAHQSIHG